MKPIYILKNNKVVRLISEYSLKYNDDENLKVYKELDKYYFNKCFPLVKDKPKYLGYIDVNISETIFNLCIKEIKNMYMNIDSENLLCYEVESELKLVYDYITPNWYLFNIISTRIINRKEKSESVIPIPQKGNGINKLNAISEDTEIFNNKNLSRWLL